MGRKRGRKKGQRGKERKLRKSGRKSLFLRFINSVIAVVLLSALILFIALFVKELSDLNVKESNGFLSKFFTSVKSDLPDADKSLSNKDTSVDRTSVFSRFKNKNLLFKVCIISDIHQDKNNLLKALESAKKSGCPKLFVIGDITNYGDLDSLRGIKSVLDESGIEYYAIPGDHDLAQSVSVDNFRKVFGINYHFVDHEGVVFLVVDNSPNFTPMDITQIAWIEDNISKADFIILSQPLFAEGLNPPFNNIFMGSGINPPESEDLKNRQSAVRDQGKFLLEMIRENNNVGAVFAGEHHRSSELKDPVRADLTHYVVGAVTSTVKELPQSAIQPSQFSVLHIYDDKDFFVEEISID